MDDITTHTIQLTLPSLANLTELQKEFDALELPPSVREVLLHSIAMDSPVAVCDPPEAVCDPPEAVCDPPVMEPVEPVEPVEPIEPVVVPESLPQVPQVPQVETSPRTCVNCYCQ